MTVRALATAIVLLISVHGAAALAGELPDPTLTPGALNPEVTPETISSAISLRGWTATIRPPASSTNALKRQQLAEYGYQDRDPRRYEQDHRVPGVGGKGRHHAGVACGLHRRPSGGSA